MPRDERIFSHLAQTSVPPVRQRTSVLLTVLAECAVLGALLAVSLVAAEVLPVPVDAMAAFIDAPAMPEPPPPPRRGTPPRPQAPAQQATAPRELAPSEAPPALFPEPTAAGPPWDPSLERPFGPGVPDVDGGLESIGDPAPPPPPPAPRTPQRVGGRIRPPEKTKDVAPRYPSMALQARVDGVVRIEATIDESGRVREAHVLSGHALLTNEALAAVRQWEFTPTLLNGVPTAVIMSVTVRFALR